MTDINREEVHARLEASEARVATAVTDMRAELKSGLSGMRRDMETGLSEIRTDMEKMRGSMETMRADIHQMFSAQTKWIVIIVFGALATGGTIWGFLKPSNAVPSMQTMPFVIYAQPYPTQAPPAGASDGRP